MNRSLEKGAFISKTEAAMLQTVAVVLMVWHHLFGFPERITVPYVLILDRVLHIETMLSYFGKICVAVFAFVSGYGMRKKAVNSSAKPNLIPNYQSVLKQLLKFFSKYWMVFLVFVPMGYAIKVYPVDIPKFLMGLVGADDYNAEWWYIIHYVRFLLLFPLLNLAISGLQRIKPIVLHFCMLLCVLLTVLFQKINLYDTFLLYLCCFLEGMYFVDSRVFEVLYRRLPEKSWLRVSISILLLGIVFVLRTIGLPDYLLVSPFVFFIMIVVKTDFVTHQLCPFFVFVGKYSTYIWLTHTFFGYYYFQKLTFFPRYSWLIFLWCMVLSVASGIVLESLLERICKGAKRIWKGILQ